MTYRKFRNKPTTVDGIKFASQVEADRHAELTLLLQAGLITDLKAHPKFKLQAGFRANDGVWQEAITYTADFQYTETDTGCIVVEDVKSPKTAKLAAFRIKWKWTMKLNPHLTFRVVIVQHERKRRTKARI